MANLVSVLPNGTEERAGLTTNKADVGEHSLEIVINGTPHYARLDTTLSTHIVVEKNGTKYYVQKEASGEFKWSELINWEKGHVIPRTGQYTFMYNDNDKLETFILHEGDKITYKGNPFRVYRDEELLKEFSAYHPKVWEFAFNERARIEYTGE